VVASSRAGFNELVQPNLTGLLVDPSDIPALAEAMLHILRDPALAAQMGAAGRERSLLFTPQVAAKCFEEIVAQHLTGLPNV
jgi:glycosyltransferase involved in cell wall biosynthesis